MPLTPQILDKISDLCDAASQGWRDPDLALEVRRWVIAERKQQQRSDVPDNHCPYCKSSVTGPFHTRDAVYQAELDELKQENMDLRKQLSRVKSKTIVTINALNQYNELLERIVIGIRKP